MKNADVSSAMLADKTVPMPTAQQSNITFQMPGLDAEQCLSWKEFSEGESVEVFHNGKFTRIGIIDAVMADGTLASDSER